ncbi:MAG TPA: DNA/RNA non-specific endonuclease [Rhabdochlamydiaceae bacterium]|jgi:endonuclease G|nr:DNA/RNA non-specific endonuclease [Rhabdochlamydiaceae bacterium]
MTARWVYTSLLALSLTQCSHHSSETASQDFQPAPNPVIHRTGYVLAYDGKTRHASWVYEELTANNLEGSIDRAGFDFMEDPLIPASLRAAKKDYKGSGFDRGHLSPAGNARSSSQAMKDTFYLSNISPQHPQLNRKYWVKLEKHVRDLTKVYAKVYVTTGPLFMPEEEKDGKRYVHYQVIGENNVAVPTHYFKVIRGEKEHVVETEAYIIPNRPIEQDPPLKTFAVSLEKVEKAAGLLFKK